jgi:GAF domain-containing protein
MPDEPTAGQTPESLLAALAALADRVGPALEPAGHEELLRSIVSTARRLFSAAACSLALLDEREVNLVFQVADGEGADTVEGLTISADDGIAGFVVRSGQVLAIEDVRRDPRFAESFAGSTGYVPTSILAVPLETDRGILGVIEILDRDPQAGARAQEMELVGLFAQQAALAIENSRIFRGLGRTLLSALARAAENDEALGAALARTGGDERPADVEIARIALLLAELGQMGTDERKAALKLLDGFAAYAQSAKRFDW